MIAVGFIGDRLGGAEDTTASTVVLVGLAVAIIGSITGYFVWSTGDWKYLSKKSSSQSKDISEISISQFHRNQTCSETMLENQTHCKECGGEIIRATEVKDIAESSENEVCDVWQTTVVLGQKFYGNCGSKAKLKYPMNLDQLEFYVIPTSLLD